MRKAITSIIISFFALGFYLNLCFNPEIYYSFSGFQIVFPFIIIGAIILSFIAYFVDKSREVNPIDNFKGDKLFFRYGKEFYSTLIPIGLDENSTLMEVSDVKLELSKYLSSKLKEEYEGTPNYSQKSLKVQDLSLKKDERIFIKITITTSRKSTLNYFLHLNSIGTQVIIHHYAYLRGRHKWYNVLSFVTWSPIHIWSWFGSWLRGRYSIYNRLNKNFDDSSFDMIDLKTIFQSLIFTLMIHTKKFAKDTGLLTEEMKKVIFNSINNSQNINIQNSRGFSIGNISANIKSK